MSKFKVGDEVAVAAIMKITAIQPQSNGTVSYSTDSGITIPERLMEQIALAPKEPKAEEPAPAPQPAHGFKVGDRVVTKRGNGTILLTDETTHNGCILVAVDDYVYGHNGYPWTEDAGISKDRRDCMWDSEENLSPAPAPEPPKFYTGKVFAEKSVDVFFQKRDGHVFEFVDGYCENATPDQQMGGRFCSFDDFCHKASCTTWHEVKSDV